MKKLILTLFLSLLTVSTASAIEAPEEAVKAITAKLKRDGPVAILDHVDWEKAYRDILKKGGEKQTGIDSAESFQAHIRNIWSDPQKFFLSMFKKQMPEMPAEQQKALENQLQRTSTRLAEKITMEKEELKKSTYKIENTELAEDGSTAKVMVTRTTAEGKTSTEPVDLVWSTKKSAWLLSSPGFASQPSVSK